MSDDGLLNKQQRKKKARKDRQQREREAHRNLDAVTTQAIAEALRLAPEVADAASAPEAERAIDVPLASISEAQFVRKRVNDALNVGEWLTEVQVWVWRGDEHFRAPLSADGAERGFELRLEQASPAHAS